MELVFVKIISTVKNVTNVKRAITTIPSVKVSRLMDLVSREMRRQINYANKKLFPECTFNPAGVISNFTGCSAFEKPGELKTILCKKNVQGRECSDCRESFWNLQRWNPDGCEGNVRRKIRDRIISSERIIIVDFFDS